MKRNIIKYVVIVVVMVVAGIIYSCNNNESISLDDSEVMEEQSTQEETTTSIEVEIESEINKSVVVVYVCGAVNQPDVYEFDNGTRVIDAIKSAGGFTLDADTNYLNLADTLVDGSKIYVPTLKEVEEGMVPQMNVSASAVGDTAKSSKININTATIEELKTLNGIGDKRAMDIINYRESHGKFNSIEDVMLVPGIKTGAFEKIRDYIEV